MKKAANKMARGAEKVAAGITASAAKTTVEKAADVKATEATKTAETVAKSAEVKEEVKAEEKPVAAAKVEEAKAEEKKPAAKKTTAVVTTKKPAEKKVEVVPEVFIQYQNREDMVKDVVDRAKEAYVADGHRAAAIKSMQVYLKPEESAAYYVINQKYAGKVALF